MVDVDLDDTHIDNLRSLLYKLGVKSADPRLRVMPLDIKDILDSMNKAMFSCGTADSMIISGAVFKSLSEILGDEK